MNRTPRILAGSAAIAALSLSFIAGAMHRAQSQRDAATSGVDTLRLFAEVTSRLCDLSRAEGYTLGDVDACEEATDTLYRIGMLPREVLK